MHHAPLSPYDPPHHPASPPRVRRRLACAMCSIQEACLETAVATPTDHAAMRRIMAIELASFGSRPDHLIYQDIATAYNTEIRAPMLQAGMMCTAWTASQVHRK